MVLLGFQVTTPQERYDMLLAKIDEQRIEIEVAQQALHMEQEAHRHTRENFEAYTQEIGMIVVERDTAELKVHELRQELEKINPADLKKEIVEQVEVIREKAREPLPQHDNIKGAGRPTVDRERDRP